MDFYKEEQMKKWIEARIFPLGIAAIVGGVSYWLAHLATQNAVAYTTISAAPGFFMAGISAGCGIVTLVAGIVTD